jgi:hypothetical protein
MLGTFQTSARLRSNYAQCSYEDSWCYLAVTTTWN